MKSVYVLFFLYLSSTPEIKSINFKSILKNPFAQNYQEVTTKEQLCQKDTILEVENEIGNISITSWKQPKIVVEAKKTGSEETVRAMKILITKQNEKIKIKPFAPENIEKVTVDLHILVPEKIILSSISTRNGSIKIKHIKGPITASTQNGSIDIINAQKTVIAQSSRGDITIKQSHLSKKSALIIDVSWGNVEVSLARAIEADLNLHTAKGVVTSEQHVMLNETCAKLDRLSWENLSKNVQAKLGPGGAPINIKVSQRGDICLKEY